jgi:hypothetical protein
MYSMYVCMYEYMYVSNMYVRQAMKGDVVEVVYEAAALKISNNALLQGDTLAIKDGYSGAAHIHIHTYIHTYIVADNDVFEHRTLLRCGRG